MTNDPTREPSLTSLLSGDGWRGLEGVEQRMVSNAREIEARRAEMAEKVLRVFEAGDGRDVLDWLLDRTLRKASMPRLDRINMLASSEQLLPHMLFREGENAIVEEIVTLMRVALKRREKR